MTDIHINPTTEGNTMTIATTTETTETKTVAVEDLIFEAEILKMKDGLPATVRCDTCGAQAYVEIEVKAGSFSLCSHHYVKHEDALVTQAKRIIDHRDYLLIQENRYKNS